MLDKHFNYTNNFRLNKTSTKHQQKYVQHAKLRK
jgi:hypothetical protein